MQGSLRIVFQKIMKHFMWLKNDQEIRIFKLYLFYLDEKSKAQSLLYLHWISCKLVVFSCNTLFSFTLFCSILGQCCPIAYACMCTTMFTFTFGKIPPFFDCYFFPSWPRVWGRRFQQIFLLRQRNRNSGKEVKSEKCSGHSVPL